MYFLTYVSNGDDLRETRRVEELPSKGDWVIFDKGEGETHVVYEVNRIIRVHGQYGGEDGQVVVVSRVPALNSEWIEDLRARVGGPLWGATNALH